MNTLIERLNGYCIEHCCNPENPIMVTNTEMASRNKCKLFKTIEEARIWVRSKSAEESV